MFTLKVNYNNIVDQLFSGVIISFNGKSEVTLAVWDTGSTRSGISKEIARKLNVITNGMEEAIGISGKENFESCDIDLLLVDSPENAYKLNDITVSILKNNLIPEVGMLIGMDIISRGDLQIINSSGKTELTFTINES